MFEAQCDGGLFQIALQTMAEYESHHADRGKVFLGRMLKPVMFSLRTGGEIGEELQTPQRH